MKKLINLEGDDRFNWLSLAAMFLVLLVSRLARLIYVVAYYYFLPFFVILLVQVYSLNPL